MKNFLRWAAFLMLMGMGAVSWAADTNILLAPPDPPVLGGQAVTLQLYLHNNTDAAVTRSLPLEVPCRIDTGRSPRTVVAELVGETDGTEVQIPAQGFVRRQYRLPMPVSVTGTVRLAMSALNTNDVTFTVGKSASAEWHGEQLALDDGPTMVQSFLENFSIHDPTYFLLGVDPGIQQSKFQFSFKYRLFDPHGSLTGIAPPMASLYLAYTQRSIWDLKGASQPFDDTSYMPQLFYEFPKIDLNIERITAFGVRTGFMHESNGKAGDDSRSTNYIFVKPIMGLHLAGPYYLKLAPNIFAYVNNDDETNGDLKDYRGYFDFQVELLDPDGLALDSHFWWADKGASVQLDLTYPMTRLWTKAFSLYLQAQYFSGYGETLLHYDRRQDVFRLGLSIVR
ncbi:putative Outer membrane phospholipase A-like protein [Desulfosarcina cetonica]|uniref:phospholipase A n=1 Tax=Desulfosarcina cetonica TaxID=90730 RepID=UPI0006D147C9|nr:phospholipase A [Desulfosarcina cetonica]VTR69521.1 putative Outer membrane phospholipase A-like protein [Desulfosarcina cetonica]